MAQPTKLFHWASAGGALKTDPPSGKQDSGFVAPSGVPEKPALDYFNSILGNLFDWGLYLKNLASEAFVWTGSHTFNLAVTMGGNLAVAGVTALGTATATALTASAATVTGMLSLSQDPGLPSRGLTAPSSFGTGWTAVLGDEPRAYKMLAGEIRLRGTAVAGTSPGGTLMTLPSGYRPGVDSTFPVAHTITGATSVSVIVSAGGGVSLTAQNASGSNVTPATTDQVHLDGITFNTAF